MLGFDRGEIALARLGAQGEALADCMLNRGFELDPADAITNEPPQRPTREFGGAIAFLRTQVVAWSAASASGDLIGSPSEAAYSEAFGVCFDESAEKVGDPLAELGAWLSESEVDLDAKVESDPRVQAAVTEFESCMSNAGLSSSDPIELSNELVVEGNGLLAEVMSGKLSAEVADQMLAQLQIEEETIAAAIEPCLRGRSAVFVSVQNEVYESFAETNYAAIVERLDNVDLSPVEEYLRQVEPIG